jgi:hypothetical protein
MSGKPARPTRSAWAGVGQIAGPEDPRRIMAEINAAGLDRTNTATATRLVWTAEDVAVAEPDLTQVLPAHPALRALLPWPGGIRRGATVAAVGSTSLLIALLASAMAEGSWAAIVGMPAFGALAAAEADVPIQRLALVPEPGPDWPTDVSALIDGVDLVVVATPPGVAESVTRALMNRARQKRVVLVSTTVWAGCDLVIKLIDRNWTGLGQGHGRLRRQQMTWESVGRGRAAQSRKVTVTMPAFPDLQGLAETEPPFDEPGSGVPAAAVWGEIQPNAAPVDPWADLSGRRAAKP